MKKVITTVVLCVLLSVFFSVNANAVQEKEEQQNEIYNIQLEESGANELFYSLPQETQQELRQLGIDNISWESLNSLSFGAVLNAVMNMLAKNGQTPVSAVAQVIGLMLLCALADSMKLSVGDRPLGGMVGAVGALCVSAVLVFPISQVVAAASEVIKTAANFMMLFLPVMAGIMAASGQSVTGASYYTLMMGAGQAVTLVSSNVIVPAMNIFLGLSTISAVSAKINLSGVCTLFTKVTKWVLTFVMSVFVSVLTFQTVIGSAADTTGVRAARFAISSVVPLVGGALSDAFLTVHSCMKLLKSGVGVFAILASAFIFLPIVLECIIWLFTVNICSAAGDMLNLPLICKLLRNSGKVVSVLLAIILCIMTVFIISITLIIMIGGS